MIVTVHLLCGRGCRMGGVFYMMINKNCTQGWLWGMLPQENFEKNSVIWCVFVYIWIRFCLK